MKNQKKLKKKMHKVAKHPQREIFKSLGRSRFGWLAVAGPLLWENREAILDFVGEVSERVRGIKSRSHDTEHQAQERSGKGRRAA